MTAPSSQLPFSEIRQAAILGHLLTDHVFAAKSQQIQKEWFVHVWDSKLKAALDEFRRSFRRQPKIEELKVGDTLRLATLGEQAKMLLRIDHALEAAKTYGLDTLKPELTTWLHARYFHEGAASSMALFNSGKFEEAFSVMGEKLRSIRQAEFGTESKVTDWNNWEADLDAEEVQTQGALTFGSAEFDRLLLPQGTGGSLIPGDQTLLIAPSNVGKTTCCISIAAANVRAGKDVLFVSLEGRPGDIRSKILRNMMQMNVQQFQSARQDPAQRLKIEAAATLLKAHLIYIALHDAGQTVEAVGDAIEAQQEEWKQAHGGKGFDLLVADYPAKLYSRHEMREERQRLDYVYNFFVLLALEHGWHSVVAIQSNREGSRSNRGSTGRSTDRRVLLDPESVSEAYGPVCTAANVITLNRPTDAEYITFNISKSRSSQTGWAVLCESNFAAGITHREGGRCCWYRDNVQPGPWASHAIERYAGRIVPPAAITDAGIQPDIGADVRSLKPVPKADTDRTSVKQPFKQQSCR